MPRLRRLVLLIVMLAATVVRAEQVAGLFEAEVPIDDSRQGSQDAAVREGYRAVLVKLAGSRQVLENPVVAQSIGRSKDFLVQFFRLRSAWPLREGETVAPQLLHVVFQPAAVQNVLREAGVPILAANRPGVLLWVVVEDEAGPRVLNRDSDPAMSGWLDMHAKRRGVPLLFPALDLEDTAVDAGVLGALDSSVVLQASQRYGAAVVALARLHKGEDGAWQGAWRVHLGEQALDGAAQAAAVDQLDAQFVDFIAESVAAKYAIASSAGELQQMRLRIDGVHRFASWRQLQELLKGLASVRSAQLVLLDDDSLYFDIRTATTLDNVLQEITLIPQLQPASDAAELHYRWVGG